MTVMNEEEQAKYEMFKRVINLFNANPDWLRDEPALIPPLAQLVASVAKIDAIEAGAYEAGDDDDWGETDQELMGRAEAMKALVTPYKDQFIKAGLAEDFLEELQSKIDGLRKAIAKTES
jgi:hypothetical protein